MQGQRTTEGNSEFSHAEQDALLGVLDRLRQAIEQRQTALKIHQLLGALGDLLGAHCPTSLSASQSRSGAQARREIERLSFGVEEMLRLHREQGCRPSPEQLAELRNRIVNHTGRA